MVIFNERFIWVNCNDLFIRTHWNDGSWIGVSSNTELFRSGILINQDKGGYR